MKNLTVALLIFALAGVAFWFWTGRSGRDINRPPAEQVEESVDSVGIEQEHDGLDAERSSQWRKIRNAFVVAHPVCAACGSDENLNVHHIKPFHEYPELELDWDNLITLCREHHFYIGHDPDGPLGPESPNWKESNPNVVSDSEYHLQLGL